MDKAAQNAPPLGAFDIHLQFVSGTNEAEIHVAQTGVLAYAQKAHQAVPFKALNALAP